MKKILALFTVIALILGLTIVAGAAAGSPGSENDPVVTKSYVDAQIAQIKSSSSTSSTGASNTFKAVEVKAGQKLIGVEGTEIILRSGEAKAIDNGANGVSDLTGGKDLMMGYWVFPNHLLMTPRDDGRGISATTDIWVMVRGGYTLK